MFNRKIAIIGAGIIGVIVLAAVLIYVGQPSPAAQGAATTAIRAEISPADYQSQFVSSGSAHLLIDVRTPEEFGTGHIEGAVNIPVESLASRLNEVPSGQPIVVYCRSGNRSAQASNILAQAGYSTVYDLGGIIDWTAQGYPIQ